MPFGASSSSSSCFLVFRGVTFVVGVGEAAGLEGVVVAGAAFFPEVLGDVCTGFGKCDPFREVGDERGVPDCDGAPAFRGVEGFLLLDLGVSFTRVERPFRLASDGDDAFADALERPSGGAAIAFPARFFTGLSSLMSERPSKSMSQPLSEGAASELILPLNRLRRAQGVVFRIVLGVPFRL